MHGWVFSTYIHDCSYIVVHPHSSGQFTSHVCRALQCVMHGLLGKTQSTECWVKHQASDRCA